MSSHELFMNVYAKDHQSAWYQSAQAHRQAKASHHIVNGSSAWRRAGRILTQAAWALAAYRKPGATSHAG